MFRYKFYTERIDTEEETALCSTCNSTLTKNYKQADSKQTLICLTFEQIVKKG